MLAPDTIRAIRFEFGGTCIDARIFLQDFWYLLKDYSLFRILKNGLVKVEALRARRELRDAELPRPCA